MNPYKTPEADLGSEGAKLFPLKSFIFLMSSTISLSTHFYIDTKNGLAVIVLNLLLILATIALPVIFSLPSLFLKKKLFKLCLSKNQRHNQCSFWYSVIYIPNIQTNEKLTK